MKIGQTPDIPDIATPVAKSTAGASSAAAAATQQASTAAPQAGELKQAGVSVTVTVSPLTRSLETSAASGSFDADKVAAMKDAIANGTFTVDPEAIADKLLSNAQQVLRKGQVG